MAKKRKAKSEAEKKLREKSSGISSMTANAGTPTMRKCRDTTSSSHFPRSFMIAACRYHRDTSLFSSRSDSDGFVLRFNRLSHDPTSTATCRRFVSEPHDPASTVTCRKGVHPSIPQGLLLEPHVPTSTVTCRKVSSMVSTVLLLLVYRKGVRCSESSKVMTPLWHRLPPGHLSGVGV
ncbi:hypothetical protein ADUPG1_009459 [Aduncisulcus paluster]|uniref:Uncharacterized protein n=1 Tax=Aduncisulcus paluster TaxID=2918883 RepID=A0ABQ5KYI2_9EUKA|nr:hypothetical protein ADUPG1_009459 [Aduncisulcus paluster]